MNLVRRYVRKQANRPDEQPFTDSHLHAVVWKANGQIHPVRQLGVSRVQLSRVLHGHSPVSPSLALRLEQWLSGATADVWLRMQVAHDLWQARHSPNLPKVSPAAAHG